jgi:hypothetical protein
MAWVSPRVNSAEPWVRGRNADFDSIGRTVDEVTAIDAALGLEDVAAHDVGLQRLEHLADLTFGSRIVLAFRGRSAPSPCPWRRIDGVAAFILSVIL